MKYLSLVSLFFMLLSAVVHASPVEEANQLILEGKHKEAFAILEELEFEYSGDENFDLLFGFAALEAGHTSLASLALERVLAVNPDNMTARFHLARAFYVLSDYDGARREFEVLLSMNPTSGMRATIGQYLDAIASRKPGKRTNIAGYVSIGVGTDNNVNGATATNPIFIPLIGSNITFAPNELKDDDDFASIAAGMTLVHKLDDQNSLYASMDVNSQTHFDRDDLDYDLLTAGTGLQHAFGNNSLRAGLKGGYMRLDNDDYQQFYSADLEWRRTFAQRTQLGLVGSLTRYLHLDDANQGQDYDDTKLSASVLRILGEKGNHLVSFSLDAGYEDDRREKRADGELKYYTARLVGQMSFTDDHNGFVSLSWKDKEYQDQNALFQKNREEDQLQAVIGGKIGLDKSWSLRPSVMYIEQDSNIPLYSYDRTSFSLSLRKDFL